MSAAKGCGHEWYVYRCGNLQQIKVCGKKGYLCPNTCKLYAKRDLFWSNKIRKAKKRLMEKKNICEQASHGSETQYWDGKAQAYSNAAGMLDALLGDGK